MAEKAQPAQVRIAEPVFVIQVWQEYRPYLLRISVDFLISATLYLAAFAFEFLNSKLPLHGWISTSLLAVHGLFAVAAIFTFMWLSLNDIVQVHRSLRNVRS